MLNCKFLKEQMNKKGLRRDFVARKIGVNTETFSKYVRGELQPSKPVLLLMAQAFECGIEDLDPDMATTMAG